jgi:hypothetical protein
MLGRVTCGPSKSSAAANGYSKAMFLSIRSWKTFADLLAHGASSLFCEADADLLNLAV